MFLLFLHWLSFPNKEFFFNNSDSYFFIYIQYNEYIWKEYFSYVHSPHMYNGKYCIILIFLLSNMSILNPPIIIRSGLIYKTKTPQRSPFSLV